MSQIKNDAPNIIKYMSSGSKVVKFKVKFLHKKKIKKNK